MNGKWSQTEVDNILDGRANSFRQAIQDGQYSSSSPLILTTAEVLLTNDAVAGENITSPDYITSRWDSVNSKIAMPEEIDSPTYVNDLSLTFDPAVSAAGTGVIRVYIDESGTRDFTTDPLLRSYSFSFKLYPEPVSIVCTWFFGDGAGFDAKNNGVYFTIETSAAGSLYEAFFSIYRT